MKDEDISAIFKYLQSIEPVVHIVLPSVSPEDM